MRKKPKSLKRGRVLSSFKLLFCFTVVYTLLLSAVNATAVSSCTTISSPGTYILSQDITNSATYPCIYITKSDVIFDGSGYTVDGMDQSTSAGILVEGSNNQHLTNVTVKNVRVTDWEQGLSFKYADEGNITNVTATSNTQYGITLYTSHSNTLFNNNISFNSWNSYGIMIDYSNSNSLVNNIVTSNGYYGLYLYSSNGINFLNGLIEYNDYGIYLGISQNSMFSNNNLSNNWGGISSYTSDGNLVYNNYFDNQLNVYDKTGINYWNTTYNCTAGANIIGGQCIGGNYWSDYNGSDLDGDGIGDTNLPYNSDGNISDGGDWLPLLVVPPPTNLTITYNDDRSITLTWNGSAASYDVYITDNYTAGFDLGNPNVTGITERTWTDRDAGLYNQRYYRVGNTNGSVGDEAVGKFDIKLYPGLNLVSLPLIPHNNSISEVMHQNASFYPITEIYALKPNGEYVISTFYPENPPYYWWSGGGLTTLDNDRGYWFNLSLDSTGSELQITNTPLDEHYAFPSDEIIVWHVDINSSYPRQNIYRCNLSLNGNPGGCLAGDEKTPVTNYTPQPYEITRFPVIDGDIIAWGDNSSDGVGDIFLCNLSLNGGYGGCLENDTKIRITLDPSYQCCPEVSGNILVWQDKRLNPTKLDVFMYDLSMDSNGDGVPNYLENASSGGRPDPDPAEASLTSLPVYQGWPQVYGNRVVWHDLRQNVGLGWWNWEIFMYDLGPDGRYNTSDDGGEVEITNNISGTQWKPAIYGDLIVWLDNRYNSSAGEDDVVMYNISSGEEIWVTNDSYYQRYARVYGDVIVWADNRTGYWDIYMCDLSLNGRDGGCLTGDNKTRLTNLSADQQNPKVYKDKITWEDNRSGNFDIYMYTIPRRSYNFTLVGEVPTSNRSVNLTQGSNLVGWTSLEERKLWNAINQSAMDYNVTEIASFKASDGYRISTFYPGNPPDYWWSVDEFYSLSPAKGHWFNVNQSFTWSYAP